MEINVGVPIKEYEKYLIYRKKIELDIENSLTVKEAKN